MSDRARIKENSSYVKDLDSMVILNTNKASIAKHKQKMAELNRAKHVENEINNLKSEVSDIKSMLSQILKAVGGEK
jgi:CRISPR/Cas system CMR-associated protein Cmr5 small subunit